MKSYHSLPVTTGHARVLELPSTSCLSSPTVAPCCMAFILRALAALCAAVATLQPRWDVVFGAASIFRVLVASRPGRCSAPAWKGCVSCSYASMEAVRSNALQSLALPSSPRPILHPLSALYVPHWPSLRSVPEGMHHTYLTSMEAERRQSKAAMRLVVSSSTLPHGPTPPRGAPPFAVRLRERRARVLRM